tara:strand:- start:2100 stop:2894 length:795 start_codon:yes stop_codon:yes gene_type:complete
MDFKNIESRAIKTSTKIAMISGPRTVSTALMYSWGNRNDTYIWDEPLYPFFLKSTGRKDPGREKILQVHKEETNLNLVLKRIKGPIPENKSIFYQKHIASHFTEDVPANFITKMSCAFLIRHPKQMLASLWKTTPSANLYSTGLPQQVTLFKLLIDTNKKIPPVIDSDDIRKMPEKILTKTCRSLGVPFQKSMLKWAHGPRPEDGAWAPWWYESVWKSTQFNPPITKTPLPKLSKSKKLIFNKCIELYEFLSEHKIGDKNVTKI